MNDPAQRATVTRLRRVILVLSSLTAATSIAAGWLWWTRPDTLDPLMGALSDEGVQDRAVAELVDRAAGVWDASRDPLVGHVLQPGLEGKTYTGVPVASNSWGLREREIALPKPSGVTRVVILGDSFVFGYGVAAEDRLGVFLEQRLRQSSGPNNRIECLHFGIDSWNIVSECAFLRRQLGVLQPDLVVHVIVGNDLDDTAGVRGFGSWGHFSPGRPDRADGIVFLRFPQWSFGVPGLSPLTFGFDYESRSRFAEARQHMLTLREAVERVGGRYAVVSRWIRQPQVVADELLRAFAPEQVTYLPASFARDQRYRLSRSDAHWTRAGHERVAEFLYGLITDRQLLPQLSLAEDAAASAWFRQLHEEGQKAAGRARNPEAMLGARTIASALDFRQLTPATASQVHGGVDRTGRVMPYASMLLRRGGDQLVVDGRCLNRPELDGAEVGVWVDELEVERLVVAANRPVEVRQPLPEELRGRAFLSLRFVATDFAYAADDPRHCVALQLTRVAVQ